MYSKVASIAFLGIFLSGCSATSKPEPKKPEVKVVEVIENNVTTITPDPVVEQVRKPVRKKTTQEKKYKLKPEPFSLESNEADPELLGPQTTIDRGLSDTQEPSGADIEKHTDDKKSPAKDEKKEAL